MQLRDMLQRTLPEIKITPVQHPPSFLASTLSKLVTVAQFATIFGALGGDAAMQAVAGTVLHEPLLAIQQNKLPAAAGAWFVGSSISASIVKTGAFEVQIHDDVGEPVTVWSGIKHGGRPPASMSEMQDILQSLRDAGVGRAPINAPPATLSIEEAEM